MYSGEPAVDVLDLLYLLSETLLVQALAIPSLRVVCNAIYSYPLSRRDGQFLNRFLSVAPAGVDMQVALDIRQLNHRAKALFGELNLTLSFTNLGGYSPILPSVEGSRWRISPFSRRLPRLCRIRKGLSQALRPLPQVYVMLFAAVDTGARAKESWSSSRKSLKALKMMHWLW